MYKLADFGLARFYDPLHKEKVSPCGTLLYMAPEVISCSPYYSKADIWSLGIVLYIMICGQAPFDAKDLKNRIKSQPIDYSGAVWTMCPEAKDFVRKMLWRN